MKTSGPVERMGRSWTLSVGRVPAFEGGAPPDGLVAKTLRCTAKVPLSAMMSDLARRRFPPLTNKSLEPLIREMGVAPDGWLAKHLRSKRGMASRRPWSRGHHALSTAYVLADALALSAEADGRLDLPDFLRRHPELTSDFERLVTWIAGVPADLKLKQHEDSPYDLDALDDSEMWRHRAACWANDLYPNLLRAIRDEERQRRTEPMTVVDDAMDWYQHAHGQVDPSSVLWKREHVLSSNARGDPNCRVVRCGKGYSSSVPVILGQGPIGETGRRLALSVLWNEREDAVLDDADLGLRPGLQRAEELVAALMEGLALDLEEPFARLVSMDSGAGALLRLDELLREREPGATLQLISWDSFRDSNRGLLGERDVRELRQRVVGVEHTRDGIRQLERRLSDMGTLSFPVVNAAESPVKLRMAALLNAWSVVEEMHRTLQDLKAQGIAPGNEVLVVGYGSQGARVSRLLRELGYQVTVKENDAFGGRGPGEERPSRQAEQDGFKVITDFEPGTPVDIVVGCVGEACLSDDELGRLPSGTVLFSGSSSNKEFTFKKSKGWAARPFDPKSPITVFMGRPLQAGARQFDLTHHHRVLISTEGTELLLTNSGFAVDMTGAPDPIQPLLIQLTRALMRLAETQALTMPVGAPGFHPLDHAGQRRIAEHWMAVLEEQMGAEPPPMPPFLWEWMKVEFQDSLECLRAESERLSSPKGVTPERRTRSLPSGPEANVR